MHSTRKDRPNRLAFRHGGVGKKNFYAQLFELDDLRSSACGSQVKLGARRSLRFTTCSACVGDLLTYAIGNTDPFCSCSRDAQALRSGD